MSLALGGRIGRHMAARGSAMVAVRADCADCMAG
jgi:hypothetical protein